MKILFINEYAYPNVVSGAEFSMESLARALTNSGEEVVVASPKLSSGSLVFMNNEVSYVKFPFYKKVKPYKPLSPFWLNNPVFWLITAFSIIKISINRKIDIIHVHGKFVLPGVILAKFFCRKPVVVTVRDYKFLCPLSLCLISGNSSCSLNYFLTKELAFYLAIYEKTSSVLKKFLLVPRIILAKLFQKILFFSLKNADKIIAVSEATKKIYENSGIDARKLVSIYNLVTVADNKHADSKTIISVGKISYGKGSDILIKAFEKVKKAIPGARLIMVGPKSPSIKEIPLNIEHRQRVDHEKIGEIYKKAGLFVLMSRWPEPLSRASLESLNYGLALIVSDQGGNKEVVLNGVNGWIVKLNSDELAQKIISVLKDSKLRLKMGIQSRLLAEKKFDPRNIIARHINLYNNLLNEKNS